MCGRLSASSSAFQRTLKIPYRIVSYKLWLYGTNPTCKLVQSLPTTTGPSKSIESRYAAVYAAKEIIESPVTTLQLTAMLLTARCYITLSPVKSPPPLPPPACDAVFCHNPLATCFRYLRYANHIITWQVTDEQCPKQTWVCRVRRRAKQERRFPISNWAFLNAASTDRNIRACTSGKNWPIGFTFLTLKLRPGIKTAGSSWADILICQESK